MVAGHWARISVRSWGRGGHRGGSGAAGRRRAFRRAVVAGMRGRAFLLVRPVFSAGNGESGDLDGAVMTEEQDGTVAAPLRRRLVAGAADFLVVVGLGLVLEEALRVVIVEGVGLGVPPGLHQASTFVCGWVYFVQFEMRCGGRTIGKMGAGLRVVGAEDGLWLSVRYVAKVLQLLLGRGLLFGVAVLDERRRALHDYAAGTVVVVDSNPFNWNVRLPDLRHLFHGVRPPQESDYRLGYKVRPSQ